MPFYFGGFVFCFGFFAFQQERIIEKFIDMLPA